MTGRIWPVMGRISSKTDIFKAVVLEETTSMKVILHRDSGVIAYPMQGL